VTTEHLEIERKYEVSTTVAFPDLSDLPGIASVDQAPPKTLDAVYYDTDVLSLAAAGATLRRRTGGADAGWHLKLPHGGDDRSEISEPLGDDDEQVPSSFLTLVKAWLRDRELRPIAKISTQRSVRRLVGPSGEGLAEVSDDVVTAQSTPRSGEALLSTWREWEVELFDGPRKLLDAADELLLENGAERSAWPSKLHHAVGREQSAPRTDASSVTGKSPAGTVLNAYLAEQVTQIEQRDAGVRQNEADAVHKMRVATRRMRSALATFRPLVDRSVTDPLRDELKWLAATLGAARDAEVQRMHLEQAVGDEPGELVLGAVAARVELELRADYRKAYDALLAALDSARYFRLLDALDELVDTPPFTELAGGKAKRVLRKRVRRECRRLYGLGADEQSVADDQRDVRLHDIRKAAKRVRYAGEATVPALGHPATRLAHLAETLQETLGDHQDSVVIRATLRGIGVRMHLDGDNAFSIGRLHALQQARADAAEAAFEKLWADGFAEQLRKWPRH